MEKENVTKRCTKKVNQHIALQGTYNASRELSKMKVLHGSSCNKRLLRIVEDIGQCILRKDRQ